MSSVDTLDVFYALDGFEFLDEGAQRRQVADEHRQMSLEEAVACVDVDGAERCWTRCRCRRCPRCGA